MVLSIKSEKFEDKFDDLLVIDDDNSSDPLVLDLESINSQENNIFKDPKVLEFYSNVYEDSKYECRHLLDPDLTWTKKEEDHITWKNDWKVAFWSMIMFTCLNLNRGNINQALSSSFLEDNGLTNNDLNTGQTIFYIFFLVAELPFQLISKKVGSDVFVPIQLCAWSIVSLAQVGIKNRGGFFALRAMLGLIQGSFIADVCIWLSYFYDAKQLPLRMGIFYIAYPLTSVWSSLLALGLLKISTPGLPFGWQWLFLIEGLISFVIGVASFFMMPASIVETKTWYRPKGWYTDREEKILVNRILRDDPQKGDLNNRETVSIRRLWKALTDYDMVWIYFVRFLLDIGTDPMSLYLQIVLKSMGFSTALTNVLSIPYNFLIIFFTMITIYFSERFKTRAFALITVPVWVIICTLVLRYYPDAQVNRWGTWALLTVTLGHSLSYPITITWCSSNSNSVHDRTVAVAVVNIFSQLTGITSSNIYRENDAPLYHNGNWAIIAIALAGIAMTLWTRQWYIWRNKSKSKKWDSMNEDEQDEYRRTTKDTGNKRLDFQFVY